MSNLTQENQILKALKEHPEGLHPTFFIRDLFCYQYNARVNGLRARFGCECKNGNRCMGKEHIVNKRVANGTTLFFYEKSPEVDWEKMRKETIKTRDQQVINSNQMSLL